MLAEDARVAGRTVAGVLTALQDSSLQFLYSSDLVPNDLPVTVELRTRDRLTTAREVLAPHGLMLRAVSPSLYIVVRAGAPDSGRRVEGRVVDSQTGDALAGARVELLPVGRVTWSDMRGQFVFDGIAGGEDYRVRASIEDYAHGESTLRAGDGADFDPGVVRLQRASLETVVVEASRYALSGESQGARRLADVELRDQPDVADDPIRALRRVPGVVQGGASAASNLRGGETGDLLMLLDGFPLRQPYHLPAYQRPFSLLDEDLVGSIDVYTGGYPARYGNRLGGVFDMTSADASRSPRTSLGVSFFNAHARTAGVSTDEDWSWRAAARVGTLRTVMERFGVDAGRPSYGDSSATVTRRFNDNLSLSANLLWAQDEYRVNDDDEHSEIGSTTGYAWLRADISASERLTGNLVLGHTKLASDREGDVDKPQLEVGTVSDHRNAGLWDLRGNLNWQSSEHSRLNAGFEWTEGSANYDYQSAVQYAPDVAELFGRDEQSARDIHVAPTQRRIAVYVSERVQFRDDLIPELGLRVQHFRVDGGPDELTWDPRVGIRWELQPRTSVRLNWGRFHQADEVHELAVADGVTRFVPAQRSDHLILGLEHRFTSGVQLRAEAFRKLQRHARVRFENQLNAIEVLAEIAPDRVSVMPDRAEMRGIELSLGFENDTWRGWASAAAAEAFDVIGGADVPRSWDQRFGWAAGFDWHRGQWRVGAAASMHTGWPTTPLSYTAEGDPVLGARNSERLPGFASLNLRIEYRRPLALGSLAVSLEIANLTNRRNQCCTDLDIDDSDPGEPVLFTEKQYWPGFLPSLSVEWEL